MHACIHASTCVEKVKDDFLLKPYTVQFVSHYLAKYRTILDILDLNVCLEYSNHHIVIGFLSTLFHGQVFLSVYFVTTEGPRSCLIAFEEFDLDVYDEKVFALITMTR